MDIDLLSKMVKELILDNDKVVLPGLGCFTAEIIPASFSDKGYTINPPYRRLSFRSMPDEGHLLAQLYARSNNIELQMADRIVREFITELKSVLFARKTVVFPGLGRLRATRENNVFFVADENLDIYPSGFGLEPVSLKNHQESREEVAAAMQNLASILEPSAQSREVTSAQSREVASSQTREVTSPQSRELPTSQSHEVQSPQVAEPIYVPDSEPVIELVDEPVIEPVADFEPTAEPVAEPAAEPAAEPTAEPVAEPTAEPVAELVSEPTAELVAEPTAKPTAKPTAEPTAKPTAKPTAEPVAEPAAKPVANSTSADRTPARKTSDDKAAEQGTARRKALRKTLRRAARIVLYSIASVAILLGIYVIIAHLAPDFMDQILYSAEELEVLNYKF